MKIVIALFLLVVSFKCFSQQVNSEVILKVVKYKDSILNRKDAYIYFRLINNSKSKIILHSTYETYVRVILPVDNKVDTFFIGKNKEDEKYDGMPGPDTEYSLNPGDSIDSKYSLDYYMDISGIGSVKIKVIYNLNRYNPTVPDPESEWISQYFLKFNE